MIGVLEGEEREKRPEKIFEEIIAKNFSNMGKERVTQVQEAQGVPGKVNPKRIMSKHTVTKLQLESSSQVSKLSTAPYHPATVCYLFTLSGKSNFIF